MLSLSVSSKPCLPERKQALDAANPRPTACEICGAPGGHDGLLLERHLVSKDRVKHVCPICHHCLHLDFAGMKKSGRIIWLPELSQETLNLLSLSMFLVVKSTPPSQEKSDSTELLAHAKNLYGTLRKRAEHVEVALGANVNAFEKMLPRSSLSEPQHIASLIVYAQRQAKLSELVMAKRVKGLRFLPNPNYFSRYIDALSLIVDKSYPVSTWMESVRAFRQQTQEAAPSEGEGVTLDEVTTDSFDANGIAAFAVAEPQVVSAAPEAGFDEEHAPEPA